MKKRKHYTSSILQKKDGRCLLCMWLHGDESHKTLERHHVFSGTANRSKSESEGMYVYLCHAHHTQGPEAVHLHRKYSEMLQKWAQEQWESRAAAEGDADPRESWMEIFHKNYL